MPISIEVISYKNFGQCIEIKNDCCKAIVTVDVGPRIIYYGMIDGINLFREDSKRVSVEGGELFDSVYGKGEAWYHYGGHRLWFTPERTPYTYYPDNEPCKWEIVEDTLIVTAPVQRVNHVQYRFGISLAEQGTMLTVHHEIQNCGSDRRELAPWTVTQMAPEGTAVIPLPTFEQESLSPRQQLILWDNTSVADECLHWTKESVAIRQDSSQKENIKLGIHHTCGKAFYEKENYRCKIEFPFSEAGCYPDGGASFEVYCCDLFCEMETLGEIASLKSGEKVSHQIAFSLEKIDDSLF